VSRPGELTWVDRLKGVALVWIFLNHAVERIFGFPSMENPTSDWPPVEDRIGQLAPMAGHGLWDVPLNVLRYVGWTGDQGVQLFLIVSGFALTWGALNRYGEQPLPAFDFYRRRLARIYPLWWAVHLFALGAIMFLASSRSIEMTKFALSMLGVRVTGPLFYYLVSSWWFIGLILQLYLVYPLIWGGLRRVGPLRTLVLSCVCAFTIRGIGLAAFTEYLDPWQRGAIFVTRLPEFTLGVCLAWWMFHDRIATESRLNHPASVGIAVAGYGVGLILSFSLIGMTIAPFLLGAGAFVLLYGVLQRVTRRNGVGRGALAWIGVHSYALFLVHEPAVSLAIPRGHAADGWRIVAGLIGAAVLTFAGALVLESAVSSGLGLLGRVRSQLGLWWTALSCAAVVAVAMILLVGIELAIRWKWPQEAFAYSGWGERPSLEPDPDLGWRLRPSAVTHLRWESYDYTVKANSLGFPGTEYPRERALGSYRILTTGDAFTSAEGVDTDQSWPRVLERRLQDKLGERRVEVMNFAISGYGPNQYAEVVDEFGPMYRPDLILIGFFVNDYGDVLVSDEKVRQEIGFWRPPPASLRAILNLSHLRHLIGVKLRGMLEEVFRHRPNWYGYYLGNFRYLERGDHDWSTFGREMAEERLTHVANTAEAIGAKVAIAMIPAPVQACGPDELEYYPRHVDLSDREHFDQELPQRVTREIAQRLGITFYDLLPVLRSVDGHCPYQPRNMHWTAAGHEVVAAYLSQALMGSGYLDAMKE
jgi:peptidoglycan/LPS O-acetylase OafA/YrhL